MPGMAASTSETCEFGSPPNAVAAPENNLACEVTCACISMPMTTSQSPVAPLISFDFVTAAFIALIQNPRPIVLETPALFPFCYPLAPPATRLPQFRPRPPRNLDGPACVGSASGYRR